MPSMYRIAIVGAILVIAPTIHIVIAEICIAAPLYRRRIAGHGTIDVGAKHLRNVCTNAMAYMQMLRPYDGIECIEER